MLLLFFFLVYSSNASEFGLKLSKTALARTTMEIAYDGSYHKLAYPNGDVPSNIGVCTDLVIRSYREFGIDLQVLVHEDMKKNFKQYPNRWGLKRPDTNIDHRRVPNLRRYFERMGASIDLSNDFDNYLPGDLVTWDVLGRPHIGFVSHFKDAKTGRPLFIHNIGRGPELMDFFDAFERTGHYRFHEVNQ